MMRFAVLGCVVVAVGVSACGGPETPAMTETAGDCSTVYGGQVCSWSKEMDGKTVEVGLTVPVASIEGAPAEDMPAWPPEAVATLGVPAAALGASGVHDITMYWEAMGHPPGPYLVPHFDFHFNLISQADLAAIDCSDHSKPATLPAAFGLPDVDLPPDMAAMVGVPTLIGLCVPQMGMHALLASELEGKTPFEGTMVIGYYHGNPIFLEPMITRTKLMAKQSFDLAIPDVPGLATAHPTRFHAEYDAATDAYRFVLSEFSPAG
jgi:hypothetical protein